MTDVPRVLLVGGDRDGMRHLETAMVAEGWDAWSVGSGEAAFAAARFQPHLAVIEMALPDLDGLQVMRRLRADRPDLPVLFLTTAAGVEARVRALTAGGDDCVTRPFFMPEVVSRLRALLRRTRVAVNPAASLTVADLTLHEPTHQVWRAGRPLALTVTEFELLRYLMANAGRALPREQIVERVWQFDPNSSARMVDFHIAHLRKKVDANGRPLIHTIRGIGYILEER
ncbi:response regulator transcription factor [Paractinoplanes toevensis]|uniref:DNA-binding response regulator n=1 Tax=Paractinoplanes toevensis TaxID=571911 RepID=A0A919T595_9ACTN|nr:response regulator transcription factor [Actinoplanes toevensis]GIM88617.1 DNA-binding response regulator [Actinoplanes toevensis]